MVSTNKVTVSRLIHFAESRAGRQYLANLAEKLRTHPEGHRRGIEPRERTPRPRSAYLTRGHRTRTGALEGLVTALSILIPAMSATLLLLLKGWSFLFVDVATSLVAAVVISRDYRDNGTAPRRSRQAPSDGRQPSFATRNPEPELETSDDQ